MKFNKVKLSGSMYRFYVDNKLSELNFFGNVIDIGGRKSNKVGQFIQPEQQSKIWEYVNINSENDPDYLCSAENIPVKDSNYDVALLSEVLEHLENPYDVLDEIYRILKSEGVLHITVPFMFHEHGSPYDFQRWTKGKIRKELEDRKFIIQSISPLGGVLSIIFDNTRFYLKREKSKKGIFFRFLYKVAYKVLTLLSKIIFNMDKNLNKEYITSGYYVKAKKR
jgi:predicted SAM-dependent methyltransferase